MTSALENIKSIDLEEWLTLATAPAPTKLKQGQTPDMQNCWVDEKPGSVITAPGYHKVGTIPSGNPVTFCINYFKTSSGTQTFVVSDNSTVWTTVDFQNFTSIITGLSSSFQLRGAVIRDKLWLTNGSDSVRTFDGTSVVVLDGTGSTPTVPKGRYIAYHDERVWIYHVSSARSAVYFSSLTDSSANIIDPDNSAAWDTTDNFIQVSEGDADFGTGMILYRGYLHFFKQYSIWRLVGYDEYTYSRVKTRASTGTRFNESVQILDDVVHLIGVDGIYVFDGDTSVRISDIIDPATASQTAFGFNQLQQPNTNNQFWEVDSTTDFNAGTVPTNLSIDNEAILIAADDSQADFQAGPTQTNLDLTTYPGLIRMSVTGSGHASPNIALNQQAYFTPTIIYGGSVGAASFLTDGNLVNAVGCSGSNADETYAVTLPANVTVSRVILRSVSGRSNGNSYWVCVPKSGSPITSWPSDIISILGLLNIVQSGTMGASGDQTIDFPPTTTTQLIVILIGPGLVTEMEIYQPAFNTTGQFVSKTLDLGLTPLSLGTFSATETLNGEGTAYFTQSSADGIELGWSCFLYEWWGNRINT